MRIYFIYLAIIFLSGYAWRDWFPPACGLVAISAMVNHPDMPGQMFGIGGLNPWNFLLFAILPAWLVGRWRDGYTWDLPPHLALLLATYVAIILVGFVRLLVEPSPIVMTRGEMIREYLLNPLKFMLPGLLFFDGARGRSRFLMGLGAIFFVYLFVAALVFKWMPLSQVGASGDIAVRSLRRLGAETGFYRTTVSVMLAGASWGVLAARGLFSSRLASLASFGLFLALVFAQALTGGRGGYLAWACVGLVLCLLRWRVLLLVGPLLVTAILVLVPPVRDRALEGFRPSADAQMGEEAVDQDTLSAGRLLVWPYMMAKIQEAPFFGYGRLGFQRSGLYAFLVQEVDPSFPHPHNAYLEWLLDNGWIGMCLTAPFYALVVLYSLVLFRDSSHPLFVAAGGLAFSLVFSQLVGGLTGRHWYPDEETVGMWCAIGLMMRVWVERARARNQAESAPEAA